MSSVVSPVIATPAAPAESGGSGSAKGQSASGLSVVPKFTKPKKFGASATTDRLLISAFFVFVLKCQVLLFSLVRIEHWILD